MGTFQAQLWLGQNNPLPAVTKKAMRLMVTCADDDNCNDDGIDDIEGDLVRMVTVTMRMMIKATHHKYSFL